MKQSVTFLGIALFGASVMADGQAPPAAAAAGSDAQTALVRQYCAGCHSERGKAGGLSLATFDVAAAASHAEVAEHMILKLRAGMMPPPGARRPDAPALLALAASLEHRDDTAAALAPSPGRRPFQRLNRAEYGYAVKDMLGIGIDVAGLLPPDSISNGFDNVADSQALSPALMEGYLRAAGQVTALAVGDPDAESSEAHYRVPKTASQLRPPSLDSQPFPEKSGRSLGLAEVSRWPSFTLAYLTKIRSLVLLRCNSTSTPTKDSPT